MRVARNRGISFIFDADVDKVSNSNLWLEYKSNSRPQDRPTRLEYKYVIIAAGIHQNLLTQLGMDRDHEERSWNIKEYTKWLVADFSISNSKENPWNLDLSSGTFIMQTRFTPDHPYINLVLTSNGVASVYASPYIFLNGNFPPKEKRSKEEVMRESARRLGIQGDLVGPVNEFQVHARQIGTPSNVGYRLLAVGDAAVSLDPFTGYGFNLSVSTHSEAVKGFFQWALKADILTNDREKDDQLVQAFDRFDKRMGISFTRAKLQSQLFARMRDSIGSSNRGLGGVPLNMLPAGDKLDSSRQNAIESDGICNTLLIESGSGADADKSTKL